MSSTPFSDQEKRSIVLVEDDDMIAELISEVLGDEGHDVIGPFQTCKDAEHYFSQNKCGVVILDHHLRDGSTIQIYRKLVDEGVACVLCSGGERDQWGYVPPNSRHLHKPFRMTDLIETVTTLLQGIPLGR